MTLSGPIEISPSLEPSVRIGNSWVCISYAGRAGRDGRTRYAYRIIRPDMPDVTGDDLQSGCQGGSLADGMTDLLSFLCAAGEAYRYEMSGGKSDNADMFPPDVMEWCYQNADELSMLAIEVEENPDCIAE